MASRPEGLGSDSNLAPFFVKLVSPCSLIGDSETTRSHVLSFAFVFGVTAEEPPRHSENTESTFLLTLTAVQTLEREPTTLFSTSAR